MDNPRWIALPKTRQQTLLDEWRDWGASDQWWGGVYGQVREEMALIGVGVTHMHFTGFYSQGDGAAIEGWVQNWELALDVIGEAKFAPSVKDEGWSFKTASVGNYCHSNTLQAKAEFHLEQNPFDQDEDPLRYHAWDLKGYPTEADLDRVESKLLSLFKARSDDLYRRLEQEYDGLTNDNAVIENILDQLTDEELVGEESFSAA
jgi:hypothetical protein